MKFLALSCLDESQKTLDIMSTRKIYIWLLGKVIRRLRRMRLWRLRREVFDLAGYVIHHVRYLVMRILDARDHLIEQFLAAMHRLAQL